MPLSVTWLPPPLDDTFPPEVAVAEVIVVAAFVVTVGRALPPLF